MLADLVLLKSKKEHPPPATNEPPSPVADVLPAAAEEPAPFPIVSRSSVDGCILCL